MVNIRTKGQTGEREVAKMFNEWSEDVRATMQLQPLDTRDLPFQRNQNQTAVGGDDLTNPFGLSIEVKRQEQLSIGSWWKQCCESAARTDGIPILIFKQNRKKWRVCMFAGLPLEGGSLRVMAEIGLPDLETWFKQHCYTKLSIGESSPL